MAPASLDVSALDDAFPPAARAAASSGLAIVRIDLTAEGVVAEVTVLREDPAGYGFGEACANVIRAHSSGWEPALDDAGHPVAHRLSYRCVFEVRVPAPTPP